MIGRGSGSGGRSRAVLVVMALLLTACGSRIDGDRLAAGGVEGDAAVGDEFTLPTDGGGEVVVDPVTGEVVASPSIGGGASSPVRSGSTGGSSGGSTAGPGGGGGGAAGSGALTASSPGVTETEIKIGLIYDKSAGTTNAALGFSGIGQVDQRRAYDALIADVNSRGGVLGRKLVPVYVEFDSAGPDASAGTDVLEQRICNTFTENRVFVAFYGGGEVFTRCMNKLGVVRISDDGVDAKLLAESPYLVVLAVNLDRAAGFIVDRLHALDYYAEGKNDEVDLKIGLLRYDHEAHATGAAVIKQRLESKGLKLADEVAVRQAETVDQVGDETNAIRAAALRFKSNGITHVQFIGTGSAYLELIFMQNAEKQLYRPRYGMASWDGGQALATLLGNDAGPQLSGALEIGWFPIFDVHRSEYSGDKTTKAFQHCIKVLEDAGESFTSGDPTRNKEAIAAIYCDNFNYFVAAGTHAGADLTPDSFMQRGVAQVDGLDSAKTFILSTTQRRDAIGGVRDAKFHDDCTCFRYISQTVVRV